MLNKILVFIVIHYKLFKLLFRATKKGYLREIGWIDSYKTQAPVNKKLEPIPWVTYSFISYIENRLNKPWKAKDTAGELLEYYHLDNIDFTEGNWMVLAQTNKLLDEIGSHFFKIGMRFERKGNKILTNN